MTAPTLLFFVITLGFTWLLQLPIVLAQRGFIEGDPNRFMALAALGGFGPLLGAVVAARFDGGVRGLCRRFLDWRVGAQWYLVALLAIPLVYVAAASVYRAFGGEDAALLYLPENAQHIGAMILVPLVEETGWRGFALPRLQQRHGALVGTAILGVAWSAWHIMMFLAVTTSTTVLLVSLLNIFAGAFVFTWLFNRTRGSLLIAIVAHMGVHLNNPAHATNAAPMVIYTAAIAVFALALIVIDRTAWRPPYPNPNPNPNANPRGALAS